MMKRVRVGLLLCGALMMAACGSADEGTTEASGAESDALSGCQGFVMGGPTSCKPPSLWKSYATSDCAAKGKSLGSYVPFTSCGSGNYRYVKYTCC